MQSSPALFLSKPDAFSLPTESDCVEAYLACYDLLMFTFQKISFQDNRPGLAMLDPQVHVHPQQPGAHPSEQLPHPQKTNGYSMVREHFGPSLIGLELQTGTKVGEAAVIEMSRFSGASCYGVVVLFLDCCGR